MPYTLLHHPIMLVLTSNLATTFPNTDPENFPWQTEQRPFAQVRSRPATLGPVTTDIKTKDCPCCVEIPDENVGAATISGLSTVDGGGKYKQVSARCSIQSNSCPGRQRPTPEAADRTRRHRKQQ
jgi:hypothetical protein